MARGAQVGVGYESNEDNLVLGFTPRQMLMVSSEASIVGYGGSAGGGKTRGAINLAYNYCLQYPGYESVIVRSTFEEAKKQGAIWDEIKDIAYALGPDVCTVNLSTLRVNLCNGSSLQLGALKDESTHNAYKGSQFQLLLADEATEIRGFQLLYLQSRLRVVEEHEDWPVRTIFLSNPDRLSPMYHWLAPWVSTKHDWYPYPPGKLLYMEVLDEKESTVRHFMEPGENRQSITFIPARLHHNPYLKKTDYGKRLAALGRVERERLLYGNWEASYIKGGVFEIDLIQFWDIVSDSRQWQGEVRFWDTAASEKRDGDYTVGLRALSDGETMVVTDIHRQRNRPGELRQIIKRVAERDGPEVRVVLEQEPASQSGEFVNGVRDLLSGYVVESVRPVKDKITRAEPVAAMVRNKKLAVLRRSWSNEFVAELEAFPKGDYDDQVDALSMAYRAMFRNVKISARSWPGIGVSL